MCETETQMTQNHRKYEDPNKLINSNNIVSRSSRQKNSHVHELDAQWWWESDDLERVGVKNNINSWVKIVYTTIQISGPV